MNHEHACAHVHEHIERVQCLIMMLIDNDNGHVHVHVPCCAPCMKQTIIVFCDATRVAPTKKGKGQGGVEEL